MLLPGTNWEIRTGENWAVLGPNGSGKSALARALKGDIAPVRGRLIRHDAKLLGNSIGYVSFELIEEIVSREEFRDEERAFSGRGRELTVAELMGIKGGLPPGLKKMGDALVIEPLLQNGIRSLSNGELRKVLIARALLPEPRLLILDDPFAGLDARSRPSLAEAITNLIEGGTQLILITQRPEEVLPGISHVLLIGEGRVLLSGPRQDVLTPARLRHFLGKTGMRRLSSLPLPLPKAAPAGDLGEPLVEMRNIRVAYGQKVVLDGLYWTARRGEHWAIVGPNGAGKSTLLSLITGDNLQVYANEVFLFGRRRGAGESIWEIRRRIGVVSPELQLRYRRPVPVRDVVLSGFFDSVGLYRRPDPHQEEVADRWLEVLELAERAGRLFTHLSYGEKRLVLIARAMVKAPELLILDEPCQGLDSGNREKVLGLLEQIGEETATSLLYVTHHEEELLPCIRHVLRLEKKKEEETPLRQAPGSP